MKLNFLNNPSQRLASGKTLPTNRLEAVIIFGTQAQRMKLLHKILPQAFHLAVHRETYHLVLTLLTHCDNTIKTELLFQLRRKFIELSKVKHGNLVAQKLIETVPATQKREIAELFVIGAEEDEFVDLARHMMGNHVVQRMMEFTMCVDALEDKITTHLMELATHLHGQHVVSALIEKTDTGAELALKVLFPNGAFDNVQKCEEIAGALSESTVLSSLLRSPHVPREAKDSLVLLASASVDDFLQPKAAGSKTEGEEEDFSETTFAGVEGATRTGLAAKSNSGLRHTHFLASAIAAAGSDQDAVEFYALLHPYLTVLAEQASMARIFASLYQRLAVAGPTCAKHRKELIASLLGSDVVEAAEVPPFSLVLRVAVENDLADFPKGAVAALVGAADQLCTSQCGSPVLQALVANHSTQAAAVAQRLLAIQRTQLLEIAKTVGGSILLQHVIEHAAETRQALIDALLSTIDSPVKNVNQPITDSQKGDAVTKTSSKKDGAKKKKTEKATDVAPALQEPFPEIKDDEGCFTVTVGAFTQPGSRLLQKIVAFASDETVRVIAKHFVPAEAGSWTAIHAKAAAINPHACFVLQALLPALRDRDMTAERRAIMDQLKRCVFDLATSRWAGRVVLDSMFLVASEALRNAIKEVIFLKVEDALSAVPESAKALGASSSSVMRVVNENNKRARRIEGADGSEHLPVRRERKEQAATVSKTESDPAVAPKKTQKKMFRSLKK